MNTPTLFNMEGKKKPTKKYAWLNPNLKSMEIYSNHDFKWNRLKTLK